MTLDIHDKIAIVLILIFVFISTFSMPTIYELILKSLIVLAIVVNVSMKFLAKEETNNLKLNKINFM